MKTVYLIFLIMLFIYTGIGKQNEMNTLYSKENKVYNFNSYMLIEANKLVLIRGGCAVDCKGTNPARCQLRKYEGSCPGCTKQWIYDCADYEYGGDCGVWANNPPTQQKACVCPGDDIMIDPCCTS